MKEFWESRYNEEEFAYGTEPNGFLASQAQYIQPGMHALAIADGEGRNGVWLAEKGCQVTTVDYSQAGVTKSQRLAAERGVSVEAICADLGEWDWPEATFDVVISIFAHFPPSLREHVHKQIIKSLKPGGVLLLEAYHPRQVEYGTGGPQDPALAYTLDTLSSDFAGQEIIVLDELDTNVIEGKYHTGKGAVVRLVMKKS